ncbi:MAG: class I SAM-dependent methyltransferase [Anaerolineae bacterium]|nr:class I SAM-dependent methyltransferase [Anaerolineae bacterium]
MGKATDSATISTALLQEVAQFDAKDRVLSLTAEPFTLLRQLARTVAQLDVYDLDYSHLAALPAQNNMHVHTSVYPQGDARYDKVIIFVPKGRDVAKAQLWAAAKSLADDGMVYVCGPTKGGAKTILKDASELFAEANTLIFKKRHRVGGLGKPTATRYPSDWGADPTQRQQRTFNLPDGLSLLVSTMPGIFSWDALDEGTRLLLEKVDPETDIRGKAVLDIGCGNGVIGGWAAKYADRVTMVDDNLLAVECSQMTLAQNDINNAEALASDVYSALDGQQYDLIVTNPPFHDKFDVTTNVAHRIIREAKAHLKRDGALIWVANAFLRYESVAEEHFRSVELLGGNTKYVVVKASRPK